MKGFNLSICFTTWNRTDLLYQAVEPFVKDNRINEIVISDDHSNENIIAEVWAKYEFTSKVRVYKNQTNLDCYFNKAKAITRAQNEWVCILDSDNIFEKAFIDRIESLVIAGLNPRTIYQPDFAKPHFDFRKYSGKNVTGSSAAEFASDDMFCTSLNAMNYLVNRSEYLQVFDASIDPVTSDSIYQNYRWLAAGNSIYYVPDFQYQHRVHDQSHYQNNVKRTPKGFYEDIVNRIKQLK